jgi:hypothetical protein
LGKIIAYLPSKRTRASFYPCSLLKIQVVIPAVNQWASALASQSFHRSVFMAAYYIEAGYINKKAFKHLGI